MILQIIVYDLSGKETNHLSIKPFSGYWGVALWKGGKITIFHSGAISEQNQGGSNCFFCEKSCFTPCFSA